MKKNVEFWSNILFWLSFFSLVHSLRMEKIYFLLRWSVKYCPLLLLRFLSSNVRCILTKTLIHVSVLYYQKTRMLRASNSAYYSYRDNKQRRPGYFRSISRYTVYLDDTYASIMLSYERVWLRNYSLSSDALEEGCHWPPQ